MRLYEIPKEVSEWLGTQEEKFTIFVYGMHGLHIVMNGDLPLQLWNAYRKGNLKSFLDSINYEEKESLPEKRIPEDIFCRMFTLVRIQDLDDDPNGKSSSYMLLADLWRQSEGP